MDPDATLRDIMEAVHDGDRDTAMELASELAGWIDRGGRAPIALTVCMRAANAGACHPTAAKPVFRVMFHPEE